nr:Unknown Function [uncultured bacterium]
MLFDVNVVLVVIATDIKNRQNASVLTETKNNVITLPAKDLLVNQTSRVVAGEMLEEYTGVSSNWAVLAPLGVFDAPTKKLDEIRVIDVVFAVYIPERTRQRNPSMQWITFGELNELNIRGQFYADAFNMVSAAIWRPI